LDVFQNKIATKSKQNSNKIMILFDQNFDFVAILLLFCFENVQLIFETYCRSK
jgi:hypothetical protein